MKLKMFVAIVSVAATSCSFSGGADTTPECEKYCDLMVDNCPGTYLSEGKFDQELCAASCEGFARREFLNASGAAVPLGDPVPNSDTLECRTYHANNASAQQDGVHCTHASPGGGGICVQFQPPCERYCAGVGSPEQSFGGVVEACQGEEGAFADIDACADFCNGLAAGQEGDFDGNTAHCRISWSEEIAGDPEDKTPICQNALADSSVCVSR